MVNYLVLDTETGGVQPERNSILSVAGFAWNPGQEPELLFDFLINEGTLTVDADALDINKMNLNDVVFNGLSPEHAVELMKQIIIEHYGPDKRLTLVGHNITFDVDFLKRLFRLAGQPEAYDDFFVHRTIDTASVLTTLMMLGLVPQGSASSNRLFELANVSVPTHDRHTAKGDAYATAIAMNNLIALHGQGSEND